MDPFAVAFREEYKGGKRVGTWTVFHENGSVASIVDWRNGRLHGRNQYFLPNGTPKRDGSMVNGAREGTWSDFYDDGRIETEINYLNGMRSGRYRSWHKNGQLHQSGGFKNDREDGLRATWRPDRTREEEGLASNGARVGSWTYGAKGRTPARVVDHGIRQTHSMRQIMTKDGQVVLDPVMPPPIVRKDNRVSP